MSTESRLREVIDSGQEVTITFSNQNPLTSEGRAVQSATGRIVSTNSPDVVDFQPLHGAPVPIPVTRILKVE
ncbi:MAG TPA: hypothetical protein VFV52_05670 [Bacilli bacterium]|nr:hypothetical protein [Bacilli bacterium]